MEQIKSILLVLIGELEERFKSGIGAQVLLEELAKKSADLLDVNPKILILSL